MRCPLIPVKKSPLSSFFFLIREEYSRISHFPINLSLFFFSAHFLTACQVHTHTWHWILQPSYLMVLPGYSAVRCRVPYRPERRSAFYRSIVSSSFIKLSKLISKYRRFFGSTYFLLLSNDLSKVSVRYPTLPCTDGYPKRSLRFSIQLASRIRTSEMFFFFF